MYITTAAQIHRILRGIGWPVVVPEFVCGSFVERVGEHNILEPAMYGFPTIVGPYMHGQKALFESASSQGAIIQTDLSALLQCVQNLLSNNEEHHLMSNKAKTWAHSLKPGFKGASERTTTILFSVV